MEVKMESPQTNSGTKAGVIGGLLFVFIGLTLGEIVKTASLAAVGAAVSYGVTLAMRWITGKIKRKV
jgi:hypothetical protein